MPNCANIARYLVRKLIEQRPAVALTGARQVGKTTLAKIIAENEFSVYVDLQNPKDVQRLEDPLTFFAAHCEKLIILDEIHQFPELFPILRGVIDTNRYEGRKGKQFFTTRFCIVTFITSDIRKSRRTNRLS